MGRDCPDLHPRLCVQLRVAGGRTSRVGCVESSKPHHSTDFDDEISGFPATAPIEWRRCIGADLTHPTRLNGIIETRGWLLSRTETDVTCESTIHGLSVTIAETVGTPMDEIFSL